MLRSSATGNNGAMTPLILSTVLFCAMLSVLRVSGVLAMIVGVRGSRRAGARVDGDEGVSVLRPVCGIENCSELTLASGFRLDHPRYEIVFCVAHADDPVIPLIRRLIAAHP